VLNLSSRKLTDIEFRLLGKGLSFCPKLKSHDKIKIAEDIFRFSRRLRLKEFFFENLDDNNSQSDYFKDMPFFNKKQSIFTPKSGRDHYLDFYIEAVTQEILNSLPQKRKYTNITKEELECLNNLSKSKDIIIKKADKSASIVIMNRSDYEKEVQRQLMNDNYYEQLNCDFSDQVEENVRLCIDEIKKTNDFIDKEFDIFPEKIRTPQFYILPKIHKKHNQELPIGYPGRPIISACNSWTENISKYLDYHLQPLMQNLPSYVKDTSDFIHKLKTLKLTHKKTYLVTLDVSSLYTNIPHAEGIEACRHFLETNCYNGRLSTDNICKLVNLVLNNNYFQFNGINFLQKMGTAMGSPMAPCYASLFMGKLEQMFLDGCEYKPDAWLRFLDDIFMLWTHSLEDLYKFIEALNAFHPNIKFTYNISESHVTFLDVDVYIDEKNNISTHVHVKPTNIHQYVYYTSSHPMSCKNSIPFSQAKRYRRICSDNNQFKESLDELYKYFVARNYPKPVVESAFEHFKTMSQTEALKPTVQSLNRNIIPFVIEYNPSLPNIGFIINKYWDLLKLSNNPAVRELHKYKPVMAFRRPKNIKDFLVKTNFQPQNNVKYESVKCNRPRCSHCSNIIESDSFTSSQYHTEFKLNYNTDCASSDVIYLITCKRCNMQYVGQTSQKVSKRMNNHRFDINSYTDPAFSTLVASHFNQNDHSLNDFSFMSIDKVHNNMERLIKETYWIHKLGTVYPKGLNSKIFMAYHK
jgi:hypothetical protein